MLLRSFVVPIAAERIVRASVMDETLFVVDVRELFMQLLMGKFKFSRRTH